MNYCFFVDSCFMSLKVIRIFPISLCNKRLRTKSFPALWGRATPCFVGFLPPSNFRAERVLCHVISTGYCAICHFEALPSCLYEKKMLFSFSNFNFFNMQFSQIITPLTPPNFDQNMKKNISQPICIKTD